eukprot:7796134-Pyramimonas_sp.AAC.1
MSESETQGSSRREEFLRIRREEFFGINHNTCTDWRSEKESRGRVERGGVADLQGVDLAVVADDAHGLREGPLGGGVGGEPAMVNGERGLKVLVLEVQVEHAHHHRAEHALVADGARGPAVHDKTTQQQFTRFVRGILPGMSKKE